MWLIYYKKWVELTFGTFLKKLDFRYNFASILPPFRLFFAHFWHPWAPQGTLFRLSKRSWTQLGAKWDGKAILLDFGAPGVPQSGSRRLRRRPLLRGGKVAFGTSGR